MVKNFWTDRAENKGRNSYWKLIDAAKKEAATQDGKPSTLNAAEEKIVAFIDEMENRYVECHIPPIYPKLMVEDLRDSFADSNPLILEALTSCCVMTNNFVPIKEIIFGMEEVPYAQKHALWRGTGYKGHSSYVEDFIEKTLTSHVTDAAALYAMHKQMEVKGLDLKAFYQKSMEKALETKNTSSIWLAESEEAVTFRRIAQAQADTANASFRNRVCSKQWLSGAFFAQETVKVR